MVPILRAGLGLNEGVLSIIPCARVSVVGLYRDEETLEPVPYFEKLTSDLDKRVALVVDPMLATGGSMSKAIFYRALVMREIRFLGQRSEGLLIRDCEITNLNL